MAEAAKIDGASVPAASSYAAQFDMAPADYLRGLDLFTWLRHYHLFRDLADRVSGGNVLEVGTGDGVLKRCAQPFVASYRVFDVNPRLKPDIEGDLRERRSELVGQFDAVVAAEVLEHLPFEAFAGCIAHLHAYLKPSGLAFITLPYRRRSFFFISPTQRSWLWRAPNGLLSAGEFFNRFIRGRIWIDPHHCWEIGDGHVRRRDVQALFDSAGFETVQRRNLPYCDYWLLRRRG